MAKTLACMVFHRGHYLAEGVMWRMWGRTFFGHCRCAKCGRTWEAKRG